MTYCQVNTTVPIIWQMKKLTCTPPCLNCWPSLWCRYGWAKNIEVLVFVYWLAHAASVVSAAFDILRSTIHNIVHRKSRAVIGILGQTIRFPRGDQLEEVGAGFSHLAGCPPFTVVVGAVDGCHAQIKPPAANAQCYFNRKLFPSIQLQATCDWTSLLASLTPAYDARVLKNSPVYVRQLYPPEGKCI